VKKLTADERLAKLFPSRHAWRAADDAADKLPVHATMAEHIDTWIAAYKAAGGQTKVVP
jgi:hypothetical protein